MVLCEMPHSKQTPVPGQPAVTAVNVDGASAQVAALPLQVGRRLAVGKSEYLLAEGLRSLEVNGVASARQDVQCRARDALLQ